MWDRSPAARARWALVVWAGGSCPAAPRSPFAGTPQGCAALGGLQQQQQQGTGACCTRTTAMPSEEDEPAQAARRDVGVGEAVGDCQCESGRGRWAREQREACRARGRGLPSGGRGSALGAMCELAAR
ncbi:hypothetical protein DFH27DRAFT_544469 [Peziza echinospora]|nr:hypothetical protein DFH27DRAFT_544469 [Peziza echinospora]